MNVNALLLSLIAMESCVVQANVDKDSEVTGTYEFIFCKGTCSFADRGNAFATALVVLLVQVNPGALAWGLRLPSMTLTRSLAGGWGLPKSLHAERGKPSRLRQEHSR
jgi:hypothetical protein